MSAWDLDLETMVENKKINAFIWDHSFDEWFALGFRTKKFFLIGQFIKVMGSIEM